MTLAAVCAPIVAMASETTDALQINDTHVGVLQLEGFEVPYTQLDDEENIHTNLRVGETQYTYDRSFPMTGHSAVMPAAIAELQAEGRQVLVAERSERYYVYLA